jgi:hypothetical protein
MNHCISASCSALLNVDGWNSESTHLSAAAMSAWAEVTPSPISSTAADTEYRKYLIVSS